MLFVKLLLKIKNAILLHYLFYGIPFLGAVAIVVLALDFTDGNAFLQSVQTVEGILAIVAAVLLGNGFIRFLRCRLLNRMYDTTILTTSYGTAVKVGQPGDGKTSVCVYDMYLTALHHFHELQKDYYLQSAKLPDWIADNNTKALEDFKQVAEAYEYFTDNADEYIPCLYSNVPVYDRQGRRSYSYTPDVFDQREKVPYRSVIFCDEIGQMPNLNVDVIKQSRNIPASLFFRFCRQYNELRIGATEQDPKNIYIDCRRNSKNTYMLGQRPALKPLLLCKLEDFLVNKGIRKGITNPIYLKFLEDLHTLNRRMGYRVFTYVCIGNVELGNYQKTKIKTGAIPYFTEFTYDDHHFRKEYMAKGRELLAPDELGEL